MAANPDVSRKRLEIKGVVQGVGFRPFVYSLATRFGLVGFVQNHSLGVTIEIEGRLESILQFTDALQAEAPPLARIDSVSILQMAATRDKGFSIEESKSAPSESTPVAPDVATCDACLRELDDPADRRYRYPFINCTNCGPRYTIIRETPYDRPFTTMSLFAMCRACEQEYHDPTDRRHHAQPNACPECGPQIWFVASDKIHNANVDNPTDAIDEQAIGAFHEYIDADRIVAVKGIGGFHLACAARRDAAVIELRKRKARTAKPFAVMVGTIEEAKRYAFVNAGEEQLLCSPGRPIVPLAWRPERGLSDQIAPGNATVGIMLPYSPLHRLLSQRGPLVMTSGNVSDEPIARTNAEACNRLGSLADAFLFHNREIHSVCDDSVVRVFGKCEIPIRRSRGYAPLPVRLRSHRPSVLAVGGELKATFCMTKGNHAFVSPHIGDMGNLETLAAFQRAVDHFQNLFRIKPEAVACDRHPGYLSSQWARDFARSNQLKLIEVQHHHAHIASVLAEHGAEPTERVIGVSFDGTGYGTDGAIWGGEVLVASCVDFDRVIRLKYAPLPGGDSAIKHPYRSALAQLWAANLPWDERLPCVAHVSAKERNLLRRQLERNLNCTQSSSMGRLFDAVAAILGVRQSVSYEAQAAMEMESLASSTESDPPYSYTISNGVIDVDPMLSEVLSDVIAESPIPAVISRFHHTICRIVVECCELVRAKDGLQKVALSGGVFQNGLLLGQTVDRLETVGFEVLTHRIVPCNDGGLALGQAVVALQRSTDED